MNGDPLSNPAPPAEAAPATIAKRRYCKTSRWRCAGRGRGFGEPSSAGESTLFNLIPRSTTPLQYQIGGRLLVLQTLCDM
jgi:hypothetical protein